MKKLLVALLVLSFGAFAGEKATMQAVSPQVQAETPKSDLQNDKHYLNSEGQLVQSPTKTRSGKAPAGASAKCGDGTYSFSKHHRGTCSHHGGVASWL